LAAALASGCSNPDNQVYNGIPGDSNTPNAFIYNVGSAIHGVGNFKDAQNNIVQRDVIILTDRNNLCVSLAARPDYYTNPPEAFVALFMTVQHDRIGTNLVGATNGGSAQLIVSAGPGQPVTLYPGVGGSIDVRFMDSRPGGEADGTFDTIISDNTSLGHEVFGKYQTHTCPAISNIQF
jgi:hypothetical protein